MLSEPSKNNSSFIKKHSYGEGKFDQKFIRT